MQKPNNQKNFWQKLKDIGTDADKEQQFDEILDIRNTRTFLMLGQTGHGKSETINNLLRKKIVPTSDDIHSHTDECEEYVLAFTVNGKECFFKIIDTPGSNDTNLEKRDQNWKNIQSFLDPRHIDFTFICHNFAENRMQVEQLVEDINNYINNESPKIRWNRVAIMITHAASRPKNGWIRTARYNGPENYKKTKKQKTEEIKQAFKKCTNVDLPVIFIENDKDMTENHDGLDLLPDGNSWFKDFWENIIDKKVMDSITGKLFSCAFLYDPSKDLDDGTYENILKNQSIQNIPLETFAEWTEKDIENAKGTALEPLFQKFEEQTQAQAHAQAQDLQRSKAQAQAQAQDLLQKSRVLEESKTQQDQEMQNLVSEKDNLVSENEKLISIVSEKETENELLVSEKDREIAELTKKLQETENILSDNLQKMQDANEKLQEQLLEERNKNVEESTSSEEFDDDSFDENTFEKPLLPPLSSLSRLPELPPLPPSLRASQASQTDEDDDADVFVKDTEEEPAFENANKPVNLPRTKRETEIVQKASKKSSRNIKKTVGKVMTGGGTTVAGAAGIGLIVAGGIAAAPIIVPVALVVGIGVGIVGLFTWIFS